MFGLKEKQVVAPVDTTDYRAKLQEANKKIEELIQLKELGSSSSDFVGLCQSLNLDFQIWVEKVEKDTNTTLVDEMDEAEQLWKKCEMRACIPGTERSFRSRSISTTKIADFRGKLTQGVLLKYVELAPKFDEIVIMHPSLGADPILIGRRKFNGESYSFKIMEWE